MQPATKPRQRSPDARLLVLESDGSLQHAVRSSLADHLRRGDLVVANDAATVPASLAGVHVRTARPVEVRLASMRSLATDDVSCFTAVVFGAGDHRTRTEDRPAPPRLEAGDALRLGPLDAFVEGLIGHPRLVDLRFDAPADAVWDGIARHGRPIQYAHVPEPLALWDVWTKVAARPVAFEPPSAGFALDWRMLSAFRTKGIEFATITLSAGLSSTGDPALDRRLPLDEPYHVPASTARAVERARAHEGRVIALGTTVTRALEHAAMDRRLVRSGFGVATGRVGPSMSLLVVDALVTGVHAPGESHYELLRAFAPDAALARATAAMEGAGYRSHEFGDSMLVFRRPDRSVEGRQARHDERLDQDMVSTSERAPSITGREPGTTPASRLARA